MIQVAETGLITSIVTTIEEDLVVHTGLPEDQGVVFEAAPRGDPEPEPLPVAPVTVESGPSSSNPVTGKKRRHPWGWFVAGGGVLAGSAGLGVWTLQQERLFMAAPYNAPSYGDCRRAQPCWASEREQAIQRDARQVQSFYGLSYALAGVGAGLTLAGVRGVPVTTDGRSLQFSMRW